MIGHPAAIGRSDIPAIGTLCRERGIIFHVDAAQATGKVAIDLTTLPVDLMSLASHKTYGPKGIGALYVRRKPRVRIEAQMHGGGHERGMRSGTLPTHQIVGMGEAFALANQLNPGDPLVLIMNGRRQEFHIAGIVLSPEYIFESRPGAALPDNLIAFEYPARFEPFWYDITEGFEGMPVKNGMIDVPDRPGLGVNLIPAKAKKCILIWLDGGPSHLDMFDHDWLRCVRSDIFFF